MSEFRSKEGITQVSAPLTVSSHCNNGSVRNSVVSRVRKHLQHSCYAHVRALECDFEDDVLILRGTVPSYYLKQVAQELTRQHMDSDVRIDNRVHVLYGPLRFVRRLNGRESR
jgi:hypothetical protein